MESEPTVPTAQLDARPSTAVGRSAPLPGISELSAYGGYAFIESFIDGSQNLNPDRKARKKIYLGDPTKETERAVLKEKLKLWIDVLSSSDNQNEMLDTSKEKASEVEANLQKNLLTALETTRELET
ncbi:MAG: type VI secretion system contractile sheath protein TssC, partial [Cytophagaceae bacterium]